MKVNRLTFVGPMFFVKFSILAVIIVSLTLVKPAAIAAHKSAQKICSFVMPVGECAKHC